MDLDIDLGKERVKLILRFLRACRYLKQFDVFGMDANQIASIIDYINLCDTCAVNSRDFRIHDIMSNNGCTYKQALKISDILETEDFELDDEDLPLHEECDDEELPKRKEYNKPEDIDDIF